MRHRVADMRHVRGLIDTFSVVIDLERIDVADLPGELAVSAITMAELAAGPHATTDPAERARRQDRLQRAEATFEPLPVTAVARAYGRVYAAVGAAGRKARGRRAVDLFQSANVTEMQ
jgi:predicted nucleic acid-binding protein